jgi:hypothetical protein
VEHRGIQYEVKIGIVRNQWAWVIHTPPKLRRGNSTGPRDSAVLAAMKAIDQWYYKHPGERVPPIR